MYLEQILPIELLDYIWDVQVGVMLAQLAKPATEWTFRMNIYLLLNFSLERKSVAGLGQLCSTYSLILLTNQTIHSPSLDGHTFTDAKNQACIQPQPLYSLSPKGEFRVPRALFVFAA